MGGWWVRKCVRVWTTCASAGVSDAVAKREKGVGVEKSDDVFWHWNEPPAQQRLAKRLSDKMGGSELGISFIRGSWSNRTKPFRNTSIWIQCLNMIDYSRVRQWWRHNANRVKCRCDRRLSLSFGSIWCRSWFLCANETIMNGGECHWTLSFRSIMCRQDTKPFFRRDDVFQAKREHLNVENWPKITGFIDAFDSMMEF